MAAVVLAVGLAAAGVTSVAGPAHAVPVLPTSPTLVAEPASVDPGDAVTVTVTLPAVDDVYASELSLAVDPAVLALVDGSATGPAGGFDDDRADGGVVTVDHTRLGTSPALTGDVTSTVTFTAVAAGTTSVALTGLTLVGADGGVVTAGPAGLPAASVTVVAPPVPPAPGPGDPSAEPDPQPTALEPAGDATAVAAAPGGRRSGPLAWTGTDPGPLVGIAATATLLGAAALALSALRRRRLAASPLADGAHADTGSAR